VDNLRSSVDGSTAIIEGKLLNGRQTAGGLKAWIDSLGL
jgi:hypothetical protein